MPENLLTITHRYDLPRREVSPVTKAGHDPGGGPMQLPFIINIIGKIVNTTTPWLLARTGLGRKRSSLGEINAFVVGSSGVPFLVHPKWPKIHLCARPLSVWFLFRTSGNRVNLTVKQARQLCAICHILWHDYVPWLKAPEKIKSCHLKKGCKKGSTTYTLNPENSQTSMCCRCAIRAYLGQAVVVPFANQINWARPPHHHQRPASTSCSGVNTMTHSRTNVCALFVPCAIFILREYNATQAQCAWPRFHSAHPRASQRIF